jgi:hypothetical protein
MFGYILPFIALALQITMAHAQDQQNAPAIEHMSIAELRDAVCWSQTRAMRSAIPCLQEFQRLGTQEDLVIVTKGERRKRIIALVTKYEAFLPADARKIGPAFRALP